MGSLRDDPPCIVGMGCRLPGDVCSPEDLWRLIVDQKIAQGPVPPDRYNIDGFYHPQGGNRSGSTNVSGGYFINEDIRQFDNNFFGINNLEATYMDPQQRKLLEAALECLQSSGTTMDSISGSNTGVYVANFSVDYQPGQTRDPDYMHRYTATGSGATVMSNRISHVFNLQGPSFTVDTACSSSIYALHQALNGLKTGDCDSAIVASANLMMSPELHIGAAKSGVLSPTGTSHTFDVSADGYGRAEGVSAIYVKRLSAALRDGNPIRAVIRGSAVNASGRTPGISLPSAEMQEIVMRKAYKDAGLDAAGTDYVECHGTGTPIGDPIEVDAVGRFFSPRQGSPLLIGSVKTNVGHSEAASGLTSIFKVVKAFENGRIPPSYGVVKLNPKLILKERNLKVATKSERWPRALRRGSINSFGYGGANGHVILEAADSYLAQELLSSYTNGGFTNGLHVNEVHANGVHTNDSQTNGVQTNGVHTNGTQANGAQTNGFHTNGIQGNGVQTNGVHINGTQINGIQTNGVHLNITSTNGFQTNGTHSNGTETNGIQTNGIRSKRIQINRFQTNGIHSNGISYPKGDEILVLPVSAASANSLKMLVQRMSQKVSEYHDLETLQSTAYTLSQGRDYLRYRSFLLASWDETLEKLTVTADEAARSGTADLLPFGFIFTGQGAQYAGMGKELLSQSQHFRDTIHDLDNVLQALPAPYTPSWTLEQTLLESPKTSRINEVTRSQPICTAVQLGLVNLLRSWGIQPNSVVGHSSGEIAAAYAAGLLSASQAILVAYFRGYAVDKLRTQGAMMAAGLSPSSAQSLIESKGFQAQVRVACVNAPESVTLSGSLNAIETLLVELQSKKVFARKLETGGRAYHSHMMEEIGQLYEDLLTPVLRRHHEMAMAKVAAARPDSYPLSMAEEVKMYSSVGHDPDGLRIMFSQSTSAAYWRQNLEQPVQFSAALASLAAAEKKSFLIEVGPHSALKGPIQQIRKAIGLSEKSLPYLSTLIRNEDANLRIKTLAGTLFTHGYSLAWDYVNSLDILAKQPGKLRMLHDLVPYPWDYSSGLLWSEPRASVELRNRNHIRHELLGTAALTGNGIDFTWRNILKPSEMPWIKDHKLEDQVVFPAAGYIAVAIEAVSQITGIKQQLKEKQLDFGFELHNVNVSAALNVPDENDSAAKDLELHTTMSLRKISGTSTSIDWHDFSISSFFWTSRQATLHCTGSIRVTRGKREVDSTGITVNDAEGFDLWSSTSRWYTKWHQEGLCFGPQFQSLISLRTDSLQQRHEAIATTRIEPAIVGGPYEFYPVHPITIDAGLQAACLSGAAGHVAALKTWLPVFIADCYIQPSTSTTLNSDAEGEIHVKCEEMGFSSRRIDGTIWDASRTPIVDFKDARISLYTGKNAIAVTMQQSPAGESDTGSANASPCNPLDLYMQRQPTLRVQWKPDVLRLSPQAGPQLREYVADFVEQQHPDVRDDESMAAIGALLELAGHKTPRMRVLELSGDAQGYKAKQWLNMLGKETAFPLCRSWHAGDITENGEISINDNVEGTFDALVVPKHATLASKHACTTVRERIASLVSEQGIVVARKSNAATDCLQSAGFDVLDVGKQVLLAIRPVRATDLQGRNALILQAENCSGITKEFSSTLAAFLHKEAGVIHTSIVALNQIDTVQINERDICISLVETEKEFLATMSPQAMDCLRAVTNVATDLCWVTGANMLGNEPEPNLTLSNGLSRALMLEQPTLRWSVLDIGSARKQLADPVTLNKVSGDILKTLVARYEKDDCEFILRNSLLHVSRYSPDYTVNSLFRQRLDPQTVELEKRMLGEINPARLTIGRPGVTDTICFQQLCEPTGNQAPPAGYLDIEIKAVSLNAKDVYAMSGRVETREKTTGFDFSGVVTAMGPEVNENREKSPFRVGDRVVASAPFHIGTIARVPASCVHQLLDHEQFTVMPTLLLVYSTVLYALNDRAHLRPGESVLIHGGAGGVGIAAITLAQKMGAVVYTTCGAQAKREYLISELGVAPAHIFSSRDASFVQDIMAATGRRGVDVIINSLVGDLMHDGWQSCLADFGRFVEIGKRELLDAGRLDMRAFLRNATFTAFELSELFHAKDPFQRATWDRLVAETLRLYRAGEIQAPPMEVFDVTRVSQAYRAFADKDRVGKIVISLEDPEARVPVAPATYLSLFDPDKVYLLIGCLGGLGRSLSRWMMTRGARNFVFLGRSGADKPSAQQLVSQLESTGATVCVVRGDVSQAADVVAAVSACLATGRQIGGVVQAAMGLHEALFTRMPNQAWHTGIDPKFQGTWNLHHALEGHDLDFFLLTSSVSGTVGTATESNYCSANGFLDAFARWRRSRGQPCVSVGLGMISEVGYLHENPEIEALLLRKGIQPLNEDEFLQVVDLALVSEKSGRAVSEAHMLTGLEPAAIRELSARGFDVTTHGVLIEARSSILLASLQAEKEAAEAASSQSQGAHDAASAKATAPWFKDVPAALATAFTHEAHAETMQEAIVRLIKKRFSNLVLIPVDQIDENRRMPEYGVDSMIASEFRAWFWAVFRVDLPFLDIMSPQKSLLTLAEFVEGKILQGDAK